MCIILLKKKTQVILSALCPLLCNSTRPQHTLQMFTDHCGPRQTIPWETINQGLLQPQGALYPIQTIFNHRSRDQLLEFRTSFYETISSEFLVQGNFKHTQFSRDHWHWRDSNSQPLAPKASAVSIELTWLLYLTHEPFLWLLLYWMPLRGLKSTSDLYDWAQASTIYEQNKTWKRLNKVTLLVQKVCSNLLNKKKVC